jgi:protein involved in polysaccharide export with SLBB domain
MKILRKSFFLTLLVSAISFSQLTAQSSIGLSMTDQKILEYITEASEEGKSQQEIAKQLMAWGVTTEQLRRVRAKYQSGDQQLGSQKQVATSDKASNAALREANGEVSNISEDATTTIEKVLNIEDEDEETQKDTTEIDPKEQIFGHNIFNNRNLSFEPNMNITAPQDYVLGPGDEVIVDIFGATQVSLHLTVNAEGVVVVDQYGPISIGGLTLAQADRLLRQEVGAMYESSTVRVSVGQTRSIMLNVMGEVNVPGTYHLSAFSTVFQALYSAGGVTDIGTLRNIKVYRQGREVATVDIYDYILNGITSGDIRLRDNDVIIVGPYVNIVKADGSVKRPMKYEMKEGETVKHLLKYCGGFTANAYTDAVRVMRSNGKRSTAYNVTAYDGGAFLLQDGDELTVDQHQDRFENIVEVRGAAFRPGIFHIGNDVNTIRQVIEAADGLTETAVGHHALMYRMNPDRTHSLVSVDVTGILEGKVPDMPLESEDILYIPSNEEALQKRTIEVQGEVFNPGTYEYADNETIEDLVLQAGGLLESASTVRVDIARQIQNPKATVEEGEVRAEFYTFELEDGLKINNNKTFYLQPYDQVYIRRSPSFYDQQNVEVQGQVMYAGLYALTKQNERISDLINKAGGLKQFAYIKGASLLRRLTPDEEFQIQQQIADAQVDLDTLKVKQLQQRLRSSYNVGIDLEKAMAKPGSHDDLVLRQGDVLLIPQYDNTVKVSGEVFFPNTVTYREGKNVKYYINQAGGYSEEARHRKTFIVYKNGQVSRVKRGAEVEPGCEIVVPTKVHRDYTTKASTWIAIGSSLATIAALIVNIIR